MFNREYTPDWVSAPGDTIADILHERACSESEFARQIGYSLAEVHDLLQGRATISLAVARQLERVLGASVEFWMTRDFQYRQDIQRLYVADKQWLAGLPVGDMIRFGWLRPTPHPSHEVEACLRFFGVPSVPAWHKVYGKLEERFAFRTSPSLDSRPGAVAAWLRQGEIEGQRILCDPWNPDRFRAALSNFRSLTREKDPDRFLPKLQNACAACGVAVAIVRCPAGCRASGATRFLTKEKALLLLSVRFLTDDHFWFSFFHEAGHLLLHGANGFFLEGEDTPQTTQEEEANEFAAQVLVPPEFRSEMLALRLDSRQVIRFAMDVGVSPGIIVGQLQHLGKFKRNQLNGLKRRYEWVI
jgi:plasmid maintenance system antidote protein VapI